MNILTRNNTKSVYPGIIKGNFTVPSSKSFVQRALTCSLLAKGVTTIEQVGKSDDETAVLELIQKIGVEVVRKGENIRIKSVGFSPKNDLELYIGESGLAARMLTPILSNSLYQIKLNGGGSILSRPMHFFDDVLNRVGVSFQSNNGHLPFDIQGPLIPKSIEVDGSLSSQFITGVIYGYIASPLLRNEKITILNPSSIPYIELSLAVLKLFGVELEYKENSIQFNGPYTLRPAHIVAEGDWSGAAFFLIAGAIFGSVEINNLSLNSTQADKKIVEALTDFGAQLLVDNNANTVTVKKNLYQAFEFDATHCPDLFPPLAVLASYGNGTSKIKGIHRLVHKESNRALVLQKELGKLGARLRIEGDTMLIEPSKTISSTMTIDPHGDHRIAMAASIMTLGVKKPIKIDHPQVVNKSFPTFFDVLESIRIS